MVFVVRKRAGPRIGVSGVVRVADLDWSSVDAWGLGAACHQCGMERYFEC